jgi:hypothetical protein
VKDASVGTEPSNVNGTRDGEEAPGGEQAYDG